VPHRKVLFLCTGNSCRSQMAEGWLRHYAGERAEVSSAGTKPAGLNRTAVSVMHEAGVDISGQRSKLLTQQPGFRVCDHDMRCGARGSRFPGRALSVALEF